MKYSSFFTALAVLSCVFVGFQGALFIFTGTVWDFFLMVWWFGCALLNGHLAKRYLGEGR